jgi:Cu(I)/Ag(I) efflux system protein CusF
MKRRLIVVLLTMAAPMMGSPAWSQHDSHHADQQPESASAAPMVEGEVRKVDREAQKLTIRHGPIPNLQMTSMTMVFRVSNPSMLDAVKTGDKVRFAADRVSGDLTVIRLESSK